ARRLRHLHGQREVVGRVLEEDVGGDVHLVEADVLLEVREPEGKPVGDEVDGVAAPGELLPELGRDRARAPDGGVAHHADVHTGSFNAEIAEDAENAPRMKSTKRKRRALSSWRISRRHMRERNTPVPLRPRRTSAPSAVNP